MIDMDAQVYKEWKVFIFLGLVIFVYVFVADVSWQLTRQSLKRPYLYYVQGTYNSGVLDTCLHLLYQHRTTCHARPKSYQKMSPCT